MSLNCPDAELSVVDTPRRNQKYFVYIDYDMVYVLTTTHASKRLYIIGCCSGKGYLLLGLGHPKKCCDRQVL